MSNFFTGLLVSSPNEGGLFLINDNKVHKLDGTSATGLGRASKHFVRGLQPATLLIHGEQTIEVTESTLKFHDIHDALIVDAHIYIVATTGNEIVKLNLEGEEEQRWVFPGENDSLHINCLAVWGGAVVFSAFGKFAEHRGYKGHTRNSGYVQDLNTGKHLITGLSQPHSLTAFGQNLLIANSEEQGLCEYAPSGELLRSKALGGYARGICVGEKYIFVGLSKSRNISSNGVETATLLCLDVDSWEVLDRIQVPSAEIYSIELISDQAELLDLVAKISSNTASRYSETISQQAIQIDDFSHILIEKERDVEGLGKTVAEREKHIEILKESVSASENQVHHLSQSIEERDQLLNEREAQIRTIEALVLERDAKVIQLNQLVESREAELSDQSALLKQRDRQIDEFNGALLKRDQQIASLDKSLIARDKNLFELNAVRCEEQERLKVLERMLLEKESQVESLNQHLAERDVRLTELNKALSDAQEKLAEFNELLLQKDQEIASLDAARVKNISESSEALIEEQLKLKALEKLLIEREEHTVGLIQALAEKAEHLSKSNEARTLSDAQITALNNQASASAGKIADLEKIVADYDKRLLDLGMKLVDHDAQKEEVVRRGQWALRLTEELKESRERIADLERSSSWRLTMPLREISRWVFSPIKQTKRYIKFCLRSIKRVYQKLPLSPKTKASHRNLLINKFPSLVSAADLQVESKQLSVDPSALNEGFTECAESTFGEIRIETSSQPLVSIIVPIYGKCDYTLRCLASVAENTIGIPFEVIVVDDCSPDNSVELLKAVKGIRLVCNEVNQGFIRSCNNGALAAKGKYLCFLNNDTKVLPRWLDELLRTFQEFPGTGLAGSKLIYPDGTLQEAGGIIWQDGSAWNYGRNQNPDLPVYNYAREVDYCSGASILVPKALFEELGGFDEHYLPAYCEDADLALKIRDRGYRVIYQPLSVVVHYEGVTSGRDETQGAKSYQVVNMEKMFIRWKARLQTYQKNGQNLDLAKDRMATRRVLILDHCTPTPNEDAGSVLAFNTFLLMREMGFQVTFIPEDNFLYMPGYTEALQRVGIEVLYRPYVQTVEEHLLEAKDRYDLVYLLRPRVVERNLELVRKHCPRAKVLYHTVDLQFSENGA